MSTTDHRGVGLLFAFPISIAVAFPVSISFPATMSIAMPIAFTTVRAAGVGSVGVTVLIEVSAL